MKTSAKIALAGLGAGLVGALIWNVRSRPTNRQPPNLDSASERAFIAAAAAIRKGEPFPNEQAWRDAIDAISRGAPISIIEALNRAEPVSTSLPVVSGVGNPRDSRGHYGSR